MKKKTKAINKYLYWVPRIISILFLLFLAMFSLDVITEEATFWQIVIGLFMHNIPVFILAILLYFSWKNELIGAITFASAGLLYIILVLVSGFIEKFEWYMISWIVIIAGPTFVLSYLYYLNWKFKKAHKK